MYYIKYVQLFREQYFVFIVCVCSYVYIVSDRRQERAKKENKRKKKIDDSCVFGRALTSKKNIAEKSDCYQTG